MNDARLANDLDQGLESLAESGNAWIQGSSEAAELLGLARELRVLPDPQFQAKLRSDLAEAAREKRARTTEPAKVALRVIPPSSNRSVRPVEILPSLFGLQFGNQISQRSLVASFLAHAIATALFVSAGVWAAHRAEPQPSVHVTFVQPEDFMFPLAAKETHGGGGGGDGDKIRASNGHPPQFSSEQLAPPRVVVPPDSKLTVAPTVIGPPDVTFPQTGPLGDLLSKSVIPSNGSGVGGGIGEGVGTGVGRGNGAGVGQGSDGGIGGGTFAIGGGVRAPRAIYQPNPEYSEEARKLKQQGDVVLWVVVGTDGRPHNIRVARSLGFGLDEKAIEAVRTWRFEPGTKDGRPVAVIVSIVIGFRLY